MAPTTFYATAAADSSITINHLHARETAPAGTGQSVVEEAKQSAANAFSGKTIGIIAGIAVAFIAVLVVIAVFLCSYGDGDRRQRYFFWLGKRRRDSMAAALVSTTSSSSTEALVNGGKEGLGNGSSAGSTAASSQDTLPVGPSGRKILPWQSLYGAPVGAPAPDAARMPVPAIKKSEDAVPVTTTADTTATAAIPKPPTPRKDCPLPPLPLQPTVAQMPRIHRVPVGAAAVPAVATPAPTPLAIAAISPPPQKSRRSVLPAQSPHSPRSPLPVQSPRNPRSPLPPQSPRSPRSPLTAQSPRCPRSPLRSQSPRSPRSPSSPAQSPTRRARTPPTPGSNSLRGMEKWSPQHSPLATQKPWTVAPAPRTAAAPGSDSEAKVIKEEQLEPWKGFNPS